MKHLKEKEKINVTIAEGQSTATIVFSESYLVPPSVYITETNGALEEPFNITITGCDISAIESKSNPVENINGRVFKFSITK